MSQTDRPQPNPGIMDIAAYVPGKDGAPGAAKVYKLSSNESPLGASPAAQAAAQKLLDKMSYGDAVKRNRLLFRLAIGAYIVIVAVVALGLVLAFAF